MWQYKIIIKAFHKLKLLGPKEFFGLLIPSKIVSSITKIPLSKLKKEGIQILFIDLDGTLRGMITKKSSPNIETWLKNTSSQFEVVIISNTRENEKLYQHFTVPVVNHAVKPQIVGFDRALNQIKNKRIKRGRVAVIGNNLLTDVVGGNLIGAKTVWIVPPKIF